MCDIRNAVPYYIATYGFSYLSAFPTLYLVTCTASLKLLNIGLRGVFLSLYSNTFLLIVSNQNLSDQCKWGNSRQLICISVSTKWSFLSSSRQQKPNMKIPGVWKSDVATLDAILISITLCHIPIFYFFMSVL